MALVVKLDFDILPLLRLLSEPLRVSRLGGLG